MKAVLRSAVVAVVVLATFAAHAQTPPDVLQRAAEGNDYRAFREALDGAKDVKQVYRDIDAVWSYAQSSPTGAFFDERSELMSIVRKYPGYNAAIADATLTSGGHTLYPTRETRLFLARQARGRVAAAPAAVVKPAPSRPAAETPPPTPPPAVTTTTAEPPKPVVPSPPPATTAATVTTTTIAPTTTTARPAPLIPDAPPPEPAHNANIIIAIILLIVGVGLAVLLFRASD